MAQAVSRRPVIAKARVRAWVSLFGICGGHSGTGINFLRVLRFSMSIPFHRGSILIYHLGDEQYGHWWLQFRDIVSNHRHEQEHSS
jgi:hypothetical protein